MKANLLLAAALLLALCLPSARAADGDVETSFTGPSMSSDGGTPGVFGLAVQADGKIVIGGDITSIGGTTRNWLARLNPDGTLDTSFTTIVSGGYPNYYVYDIAVQADDKILIRGNFYTVNGVSRKYLARLNADGTFDTAFNPNINGTVNNMAILPGGKILVNGYFSTVDGITRNNMARLNADGTLDTSFVPAANSPQALSMAVQEDGGILLVGSFSMGGSRYIARLLPSGAQDSSFVCQASDYPYVVVPQSNGQVLIGGSFTAVNGTTRNYIARLNADGTLDANFNPNAQSAQVVGITLQADGRILIAGGFTTVGGVTRSYLARLNADGSLDTSFNPRPNSAGRGTIVQADGRILAGGMFDTVGGLSRKYIARLLNGEALQRVSIPTPDHIQWFRSGTTPEVGEATFELSVDGGANWTFLGSGARIPGGWELTGLTLPTSGQIRARGRAMGGYSNGSSSLPESVQAFFFGNGSPPVAICRNVFTVAGSDGTAPASVDNGSYDPDSGDTITLVQTPPGPFPPGTNTVRLTVTDKDGNVAACVATVTVLTVGQTSSVIPTGSVWKYLDTGVNAGTAWKETNFNDSAWASGPAQLGYGDGDEATVVSYGPSSSSKYITTYFRRSFYLPVTGWITNLAARYIRDDGIVVYLNGIEVFRSNMPGGTIAYNTLATVAEATAIENAFHTNTLPAALLVPGTNILAVEIHQAAVDSSDLSFELELIANSGLGRTADPMPPPWADLDIGGPGAAGGAAYVTNRPVWMVQGGGADIWNTSDQFHYVYQSISGDCEIKAQGVAIGNSSPWAKAGVMIRETLLSGSKHALMNLTPVNGAQFLWRAATGSSSSDVIQSGILPPYWVKLVRSGNTFTGSTSPDGTNWTQLSSQTISMSNAVYVGLAVSAVTNSKVCMAAFVEVSGLSSLSNHQDIGGPGIAGSVFLETNTPTFLVQGGGADIWGTNDQFHYVFQPVTGNCALQARVGAAGNTDAWAKRGVMMRETLQGGARQVNTSITPGHGVQLEWRSATGGSSSWSGEGTETTPYWVRLVRWQDSFTGYKSSDGMNWTLVFSTMISMADTFHVGMEVTTVDNSVTTVAAFDSVNFVPVVNSLTAVDGDLFFQGDPIELHAAASDHDGQVTQVRYYYQDTNLIGAASVPPYAFVWTNAPPGMNYVSARAVDDQGVEGAPLTHAVFVEVSDTHVWFYSQFASSAGVILQSAAAVTNGRLRVSPSVNSAEGGAWLGQHNYVAGGFETIFQFQINNVYGDGGDGFAFVIEDSPAPRLGIGGGGIGYDGLTNSIAVEFDTYQAPDNGDPNNYHIGVHTRGLLTNSANEAYAIARTASVPDFSDGKIHTVKITCAGNFMRIYLDGFDTPVLTAAISLTNTLSLQGGKAWVGFTAAGGAWYENHDILNWSFVTTNLHPIVSLTAPTNSAVFLPTDSLVLNAAATDLDGTIQEVVFFVDGNYAGSATQSPWQLPVGALPAGPHVLSAAALDDTEAATVSAPVTILVNTPPVAQCRDLTVPADVTCTASANIDAGSYDVDPGDEIKVVQTPAGPYPLGSTVVTLTAIDTYGASNSCAATVTVVDTTPPTITCLANFKVTTAPGSCFSNVTFTVTGSDLCGAVNVLCVPPSGSAFAVGATLVNCTATDAASNAANCTFTVTVNDPEPPQITCPSDLAVSTAPGSCASNVVFTAPATDNCGTVNVLCVPPSGSAFAVGTNLVNCSATDGASNTATCAFNVNVNDPEPPQITCPTNLVVAADAGQCSKSNVTWTVTATDNCAVTNVVCEPVSGATFAVGWQTVVCTATDASGNTASCNFTVTVLDAELPQITCPANLVVNPTIGGNTITVAFAATATDNCDPSPVIVCAPPSGAEFPIGTTPVQCVATDTAGNTNSCRFSIRVNAPPEVSLVAPTNNATFPLGQPISLLADASDPDGDGVARVDFFAGTNLLGTATSGYLFVWINAPIGVHSLTARATDGAGAETTSSAVQITILAQPPITYAPVTSSNLNRQTGLYVQPVRITNPTASTIDALRLWIALDTNSVSHNVRVWNATGTSNGVASVLYNQPLPAGQSVVLNLEYYIPDRRTMPNPVFTVELIPSVAPPNPAGTVLEVDRASRLADGTFWVEFSTLSNRVYYLQYSGDVSTWKTALPAVLGTGHRVSWLDAGPPKTESAPQSATNRFYRIIRLP